MWLLILLAALVAAFGGVLLFGAPYLPTMRPQVKAALDLADLKPGQHLLELGCGDGRVLVAAAKRGLQVTGFELNPWLAGLAWLRTRRYRRQVRVVWGNLWRRDWPPAEAVFTFLLPKYMPKLDAQIRAYRHKPLKLVSFAFQVPNKKPRAQKDGVYLYHY